MFQQGRDAIFLQTNIIVEQQNDRMSGGLKTGMTGRGESTVIRDVPESEAVRKPLAQPRGRFVPAAIVDHQDFDFSLILPSVELNCSQHGREIGFQQVPSLPCGDYDRDIAQVSSAFVSLAGHCFRRFVDLEIGLGGQGAIRDLVQNLNFEHVFPRRRWTSAGFFRSPPLVVPRRIAPTRPQGRNAFR